MIFDIPEIKYDNRILEHLDVLKSVMDITGLKFTEVFDKLSHLDQEFVGQTCLAGNAVLLADSMV